ncbi:MAG TPA: hypothetical protein VIP11_23370, partial [Gemmatimonadaceae bacterium]
MHLDKVQHRLLELVRGLLTWLNLRLPFREKLGNAHLGPKTRPGRALAPVTRRRYRLIGEELGDRLRKLGQIQSSRGTRVAGDLRRNAIDLLCARAVPEGCVVPAPDRTRRMLL